MKLHKYLLTKAFIFFNSFLLELLFGNVYVYISSKKAVN